MATGAVAGPAVSFGEFVASRSVGLQRFAYLVTGNVEDARDAVQDALVGAYPRWTQVVRKGDPEAYVRRSIVNAHVSRRRRDGRESAWDPSWLEVAGPDNSPALLDAQLAVRLVTDLPLRQRAAVVLRFYEDRSYAEIGEICGCSAGAARVLVHRALTALRARFPLEDSDD
ncbi:MAG: SigE family RNA polymerase sigma factor [Propionicimonas sp.]|uniref:SigE family RNA polymerase sigma factor n=1 Tax=Propionicimonas sp. TaxID=1955623 RepID=UPI002B1F59BC|nr:SigE family RNA polymerase sigma factor [Propionicimonas sp.]MEA4945151.1 SigE family RNA polymerase sigma factor [Propionicimonas sp.]MEA5117408.1 SigE family RNA polymerase sigma factor [Propionicimonas sp.]